MRVMETFQRETSDGQTSDNQTGEDIEFIAFFLWKEVSPQVTEDSGFSAKIRGPQGLM